MLLRRPRRIVRVTAERELDSALESADQVIVEGDDTLISLAVAKASKDPLNEFSVAADGGDIVGGSKISIRSAAEEAAAELAQREVKEGVKAPFDKPSEVPLPEARIPPAASRSGGPTGIVLGVLFLIVALAIGAGLAIYLSQKAETAAPAPSASPPAASASAAPTSTVSPSNIPAILQTLVWPTVTIIAIIAVYFIATRAIARGRNVEISWKVTEKVTGRIVITKVRTRPTTRRAAVG
jgi:hypothetical protein